MGSIVLTFMSGPRDGETVSLEASGEPVNVSIGRTPDNTLSLPDDPDASRRHARLVQREEEWWLEDVGSSNGTFMGEFSRAVRVATPTKITPGQIFRVGLTRLRLEANQLNLAEAYAWREAKD